MVTEIQTQCAQNVANIKKILVKMDFGNIKVPLIYGIFHILSAQFNEANNEKRIGSNRISIANLKK